mgnify:CR=1 FL=1|tara:strand:- start:202 stop:540 length:339 start_codon:yes stop_codon:yes gene_type:complete
MAVFNTNLVIHTGTDFDQTFVLEDDRTNSAKNLTGYTGSARMRRYYSSPLTQSFQLDFTNRPLGKIRLSMTDIITKDLKPGKYSYDVCLRDGSLVECVVEGEVLVKKSVTRP